jgi:hypothetical protein
MKRKLVALLFGALLGLATAGTAVWADGNNPDGSHVPEPPWDRWRLRRLERWSFGGAFLLLPSSFS